MSELNLTHSNGNKVKLTTPDTLAANKTFKLPGADGTSGQSMVTNGSGALSFANAGVTMVDQYFLSVQKTANGNAAIALDSDFVRVSGTIPGAGHIGTGMTKNGEVFSIKLPKAGTCQPHLISKVTS